MATLVMALYAERIAVDRFTNKMDLLGVVEGLQAPKNAIEAARKQQHLPKRKRQPVMLQMPGALLLYWRRNSRTKAEGKVLSKVEIRSPAGKVLATAVQPLDFGDHKYMRGIINFGALPFAGLGTYTTRAYLKKGKRWMRAGEVLVDITPQPEPPKATVH